MKKITLIPLVAILFSLMLTPAYAQSPTPTPIVPITIYDYETGGDYELPPMDWASNSIVAGMISSFSTVMAMIFDFESAAMAYLFIIAVTMSFVITWIYNKTTGSQGGADTPAGEDQGIGDHPLYYPVKNPYRGKPFAPLNLKKRKRR